MQLYTRRGLMGVLFAVLALSGAANAMFIYLNISDVNDTFNDTIPVGNESVPLVQGFAVPLSDYQALNIQEGELFTTPEGVSVLNISALKERLDGEAQQRYNASLETCTNQLNTTQGDLKDAKAASIPAAVETVKTLIYIGFGLAIVLCGLLVLDIQKRKGEQASFDNRTFPAKDEVAMSENAEKWRRKIGGSADGK